MRAADSHTWPTPEDIMEYMDGEGTAVSRDALAEHLGACDACRTIADDLRGVSQRLQTWTVETAPAALRPPSVRPWQRALVQWNWRRPRAAVLAISAAAVLVLVSMSVQQSRLGRARGTAGFANTAPESGVAGGVVGGLPAAPPPARPFQGQSGGGGGSADASRSVQIADAPAVSPVLDQVGPARRGPQVIRTARLHVVVKAFAGVRPAVESIVSDAGGFIDRMTVTGDTAAARQLHGTLRVPADRLGEVLNRLRALGQVIEDTQATEDVTDQMVDLDARLASARATEARLTELLRHRTGKLSDVLDVERELTRVRLEIERLDAEKTNVGRRVAYAAIDVAMVEERKAGLDSGPLPFATRLRVAAADGLAAALGSVAAAVLLVVSAGPTIALWGIAAGALWMWMRRRRVRPTVSE